MSALENLMALKCTECETVVLSGDIMADAHKTGSDLKERFILQCDCGCMVLYQEMRYAYQVADHFGIHESLVSRWSARKKLFQELIKDKSKLRRLVHTYALIYVCVCV